MPYSDLFNETPYFSYENEAMCPHCGEFVPHAAFPIFLIKLQAARFFAGVPFPITSWYRCEIHNAAISGVSGSTHLLALAVDIRCRDASSRARIITGLILAGFVRIIIAKTYIHVDMDPEKPAGIWLKEVA